MYERHVMSCDDGEEGEARYSMCPPFHMVASSPPGKNVRGKEQNKRNKKEKEKHGDGYMIETKV